VKVTLSLARAEKSNVLGPIYRHVTRGFSKFILEIQTVRPHLGVTAGHDSGAADSEPA
jgi:hypothetical protein